jgi:HlyD family type I secretion membrane fusion protein
MSPPAISIPDDPLLAAVARPPVRMATLAGLLALLLFVFGFGTWSVLAPLDQAALAEGAVKDQGSRRTIQHLEGGIIREILVHDGDQVTSGQVLMRLDDTQSGSTTDALVAERWNLLAQVARLQAELAGTQAIAFPPELLQAAASSPLAQDAVDGQRQLFVSRAANLQGQLGVLMQRRAEAASQIASYQGQLVSAQRQLALIRDEKAGVQSLLQEGLETRPHLLSLERTEAAIIGTEADQAAQIDRARREIAEAEAQMQQTLDKSREDAASDLRDASDKLTDTTEKLRAARDISRRRDIVAPDDGTVLNLRFFTIGAVVRPGDPVMDLIAAHDPLVAEVQVQPHDIDIVQAGMPAEVRFPIFSARRTPPLDGAVEYVAPDATLDDTTHRTYYIARIRIAASELGKLPAGARLLPGMPVEADIRSGRRTFLSYLMKPLRDSFARSLHEK